MLTDQPGGTDCADAGRYAPRMSNVINLVARKGNNHVQWPLIVFLENNRRPSEEVEEEEEESFLCFFLSFFLFSCAACRGQSHVPPR